MRLRTRDGRTVDSTSRPHLDLLEHTEAFWLPCASTCERASLHATAVYGVSVIAHVISGSDWGSPPSTAASQRSGTGHGPGASVTSFRTFWTIKHSSVSLSSFHIVSRPLTKTPTPTKHFTHTKCPPTVSWTSSAASQRRPAPESYPARSSLTSSPTGF